jgi:cation diffusion facilitator CzcD-associated flavoprotein CzcO
MSNDTKTKASGLEVNQGQNEVDAVVIGAGFSGLYMLHRLRDILGLNVRVFEAGESVGGTWYWNRYPGARCDSDGFVYCYSFSKELLQDWELKGKYPQQAEILSYLEHVADRFDLRPNIEFNTYVKGAKYDSSRARWEVTTDRGETLFAKYLVTGIGQLAIAKYVPRIDGIESFKGEWYHTASWPSEGVDFSGKRVGVIGTGSSGVQSIPVIAAQAEHLTVFQRTPQYSIPARHESVDESFHKKIKANYDSIWDAAKTSAGGFPWQHNGKRAMEVSEDERRATYESLWAEGGFKFALGSYRDISYNEEANDTASEFIRSKIREIVKDPETREALVPSYPFLARRPIVDTNYFETYNRDNVSLVDVKRHPILEVTADGIQTEQGEVELDIIVFATGFDAVTGPFYKMDLEGRDGANLPDKWSEGPTSYLGLMTADFPNMFMITGPGSTLGNLPLTIETHVEWVSDCIEFLRENGIATIEPLPSAEEEWSNHVREAGERSMMRYADSWFTGANIPGKARSYLYYLGHFGQYRKNLQEVANSNYEGFALDSEKHEVAHARTPEAAQLSF